MMQICTVQLDFVPSSVTPGTRLWAHAEPLAWTAGDIETQISLSYLAEGMRTFAGVRRHAESRLLDFQNRRLEQILSFLEQASVDLCVFPEYSLSADKTTLSILAGFAPKVTIVAGLGIPRSGGVDALSRYSSDVVDPNSNIAVLFSGDQCHVVSKKHAAEREEILPGDGIRCVPVTIAGETVNVAVAICKDYLLSGPTVEDLTPTPGIMAIPAYTSNVAAFIPEAPRDYPRIFANHARFGGSTIFAAGCQGNFVAERTPLAIPHDSEGILGINWYGPPEQPTGLLKKPNRVSIRSAMISGSDGGTAAEIVRAFGQLSTNRPAVQDDLSELARWIDYASGKPRLALIADALNLYRQASADDLMTTELAEQLSRHFVTAQTQSVSELRSEVLDEVIRQIQESLPRYEYEFPKYELLLAAAGKYAAVRGSKNRPLGQDKSGYEEEAQSDVHFAIGFGTFDSKNALSTLSDQQDFLITFARSAPEGSRITYRLETVEDPASGNVTAHFMMEFSGPTDKESAEYFSSLERIARSLFIRGWSLYAPVREVNDGYRVAIEPGEGTWPKISADVGLLVDVLRSIGGGCLLELVGVKNNSLAAVAGSTADAETRLIELGDTTGLNWFQAQKPGDATLGVEVFVSTPRPNAALTNLVAAMLFTGGMCKISKASNDEHNVPVAYSVEVAHRILHPPHGRIEGRGVRSPRPLDIAVNDRAVVAEGAVIGVARAARPFADNTVEICIPDDSRLLHTYVIGRTGVGKTNTLKNLARYDLSRPGPVIIVDPHGDLFDYAIRHGAGRDSLIALDFASAATPSLNPIYLDAEDEADVLANIDAIIELVKNQTYFEWSGPRFADLLQLCLMTLVAVADEQNDDWADMADIIRVVEDRDFRKSLIGRLKRLQRTDLVRRWSLHENMQGTEQAEVEQWFISKFSVFRTSERLRKATGGQPSVSLKHELQMGAAVIVKIPHTVLGSEASEFIGSFLVSRVLRCALDGVFVDAETPAKLIVDEFQNFVGTSFLKLIPEARKFNLGITVANQTLSQLSGFSLHEGSRNDSLSQTLLGNVGNLIVQGVGHRDAEYLAPEVGATSADLRRIGKRSGIVVLTIGGYRHEPFTVSFSDASERPGAVAATVAPERARADLARAQQQVTAPSITRQVTTIGTDEDEDEDEDAPPSGSSLPQAAGPTDPPVSSFLEEWIQKRNRSS